MKSKKWKLLVTVLVVVGVSAFGWTGFHSVLVKVSDAEGRPVEGAVIGTVQVDTNYWTLKQTYTSPKKKTGAGGSALIIFPGTMQIASVDCPSFYPEEPRKGFRAWAQFMPTCEVRLERAQEKQLMAEGRLILDREQLQRDAFGLRFVPAAELPDGQKLKRCITFEPEQADVWVEIRSDERITGMSMQGRNGWQLQKKEGEARAPMRTAPVSGYGPLADWAGPEEFLPGVYVSTGNRFGKIEEISLNGRRGKFKPEWRLILSYAVQLEGKGIHSLNPLTKKDVPDLEKRLKQAAEPGVLEMLEACERFDREKIEELLAAGVSIDVEDDGGKTPLLRTVRRLEVEQVKYLLEKGADPEHADSGGTRPLHMVSGEERPDKTEIARLLLERKLDVNARENDGWTPLVRAVITGNLTMVKLLIEHGADVNYRCRFNDTPDCTLIRLAGMEKHPELIPVLRQAGAKE